MPQSRDTTFSRYLKQEEENDLKILKRQHKTLPQNQNER